MQYTTTISDVARLDQDTYACVVTQSAITARVTITRQPLRPYSGAYELSIAASNSSRRPLGARQKEIADGLVLVAKGELARALYAAKWHSETVTWGGRENVLWHPPVKG